MVVETKTVIKHCPNSCVEDLLGNLIKESNKKHEKKLK